MDKYQGQQNDYVLLSLVRTKLVGHFRDVRRLVVALSRARLGLYVFGRVELFANCYELKPAFSRLLQRPTQVGGRARSGGRGGRTGGGGHSVCFCTHNHIIARSLSPSLSRSWRWSRARPTAPARGSRTTPQR